MGGLKFIKEEILKIQVALISQSFVCKFQT